MLGMVFFLLWLGVPFYLIAFGWLLTVVPNEALGFAVLMLLAVCGSICLIFLIVAAFYVAIVLLACCCSCFLPPGENPRLRFTRHRNVQT